MERRLAAIVAADMAGFSRLIGLDEEGTIVRQRRLRSEIIDPIIAGNNGRIVKTTGDGLLLEFPSAVDAAKACVAIQQSVNEAEQAISDERKIAYRIGLHIGDIIVDCEDIFGDGVNVAARLETLADPGTIAASADAQRQFDGRLKADFKLSGSHQLKNIARPVEVWRWPASQDIAAIAPPCKPAIAVLRFENMSTDPGDAFFADGMAEDIITDLSRMPWFSVIARNTTFSYAGASTDPKALGEALNVSYVLQGSVRKAGDRIRITAQFTDTATGAQVWANRYDRVVTDIFDIQDEITTAIVSAIGPQFLNAEARRARAKDPTQLDAWECVMRGRSLFMRLGKEETAEGRRLFEKAAELSGGALGNADLALTHFLQAFYRWGDPTEDSEAAMVAAADAAVKADDQDAIVLAIKAWALMFVARWDEAEGLLDRAVSLAPSFSTVLGFCGSGYCITGQYEKGMALVSKAETLSPNDIFTPLWLMGIYWAHFCINDYEGAETTVQRALALAPDNPTYRRQLIATMHLMERYEERDQALDAYLAVAPHARASDARRIPGRDRYQVERFVQVLTDAGVPD